MEEHIEVEGKVTAVLAGTMFRVELDNKHVVLATISGRDNLIKSLLPGPGQHHVQEPIL